MKKLDKSNTYYKLFFEHSVTPLLIVNKNREIRVANKRFLELFQYKMEEIQGKTTEILVGNKRKFLLYTKYFREVENKVCVNDKLEYRKKDGSIIWISLEGEKFIFPEDNEEYILWSFIDVTQDIKQMLQIKKLSETDFLSGLYNRVKIDGEITRSFNKFQEEGLRFSVAIIDIDNFKSINDTYGHIIGDEVIVAIANIVKEVVSEPHLVGRWGGEEFIIIFKGKLRKAIETLEILRKRIENHYVRGINVTVSIGIEEVFDNVENLLHNADLKLYEAKNSGKNMVVSESVKSEK
jgi:diguanylate cyclase (GGDEF)-like protein/PAS domain S-box-containing protein